jgi:hypothetical protein
MIRNSTSISDEVLNTRSGRLGTCWPDMDRGLGDSRIRARVPPRGLSPQRVDEDPPEVD